MTSREREYEFVAKAAHELRNPIAVVAASAELLDRNWERLSEELRREQVAVVAQQSRRLRELTQELLDWAALESGTLPVTIEDVDVGAIVNGPLMSAGVAPDEVDVEGLVAAADPDHLTRVLINLLSNARKYGKPPVRLEGEARDEHVVLRVIDHGVGVPSDVQERLFEPFVRGSSEGTGLGLAIVRGLMDIQGGSVTYLPLESGACFEVVLKRSGPASA